MEIRPLHKADYDAVSAIYQQGIDGGDATFTTQVRSWEQWDVDKAKEARLVAVFEDKVVGWACLNKVSPNPVYKGVGETSVYVDNAFQGQGEGQILLNALVEASEQAGYWTLQALIFPENIASIHIHEKAGFRKIYLHEKFGRHNDLWRDVLLLERRSTVVGLD